MIDTFAQGLLIWFDQHGRRDLPWQQNPTPYRVWVSEIMLQQTQVNTVIPYYQRFMSHFPDVQTLAQADLDEVLHHWTGLGYYARARNLHKAAQQICTEFQGNFPQDIESVQNLAGIGRSTAGAILALAFGQCHAILDGNVKRVLSRYHALDGWAGETKNAQRLWQLAEKHTPNQRIADYTQAIMDLGATICKRSSPQCSLCPFEKDCIAHQTNSEKIYPVPKPRKKLPVKTTVFIMVQNTQGDVFLEKRPAQGIWGGLFSFPECATTEDVPAWCEKFLALTTPNYEIWQSMRHSFTHFHLEITPVHILVTLENSHQNLAFLDGFWYNSKQKCGLPAPVKKLLTQLIGIQKGELLL